MAWIFVDKEDGGSGSEKKMRQQMRRNMRGGNYHYGTSGNEYRDGYRQGYRHGWEDKEDDEEMDDMDYRRSRDSRGRYM